MKTREMVRFNRVWCLGLVLLGLVSRLPFVTSILYHWDAINFTLALKEYDIAIHQPQPPGYLLYVLLGRVVNVLLPDPNQALTAISIISSILASVTLYILGQYMFDRRTGAAASLLLLLGPLIWFYSDIAKPNIIDASLVTLAALCLWRYMRGEENFLLPSALILGLAGGFRQQTLVFLAPLAVFAFRKRSLKEMVLGASVTSLVFLASFIPMVVMAGGLARYQAAMSNLSDSFFTHTSILMGGGLQGLISNVTKWVSFTLYSLLLALLPLLAWPLVRRRAWGAAWRDERTWFLTFWMLPSLLFYTLIHMGSHGLIFTYLPAVLLVAGKAFSDLAGVSRKWAHLVFSSALLAVLLVNMLVFVVLPDRLLGGRLHIVNRATLVENDRFFGGRFSALRANFPVGKTLIVTDQWRHLQYYLPDDYVLSAPCQTGSEDSNTLTGLYLVHGGRYQEVILTDLPKLLPADLRALVIFDGPAGCFFSKLNQLPVRSLPAGEEMLYYLPLAGRDSLHYTNGTIIILP